MDQFQIRQTKLVNAVVKADGADLGIGHNLLAKEVDTEIVGACREQLTHVLIGDKKACNSAAGDLSVQSCGTLRQPSCGRSGREVKVIRCLDDKPPSEVEEFAAAACHRDSQRINGELQVSDLLLTRENNPEKWSRLFSESFFSRCDEQGESQESVREQTDLVDAVVKLDDTTVDGVGHRLLARKVVMSGDCDEELTHALIGGKDACIFTANRLKEESLELTDPACGRSGRSVRVFRCQNGQEPKEVGTFAAACHMGSVRTNGRLKVVELLLTVKEEKDWEDVFRKSFFSKCRDEASQNSRRSTGS
ncbi:MAG: hypothetical protein HY820_41725 [Acidobacteria bacterium]|nr:hypothetical protein [Acidobacteriota bacterium]